MGEVVRAKTSTGEWCKPTAELSNRDLAELLPRARRESQPAAPVLGDSWFQDSGPIVDRPPVSDAIPNVVFKEREPRPRTVMRRLTDRLVRLTEPRPVAYPIAPASHAWVWPVIGVVVAALALVCAFVRPF